MRVSRITSLVLVVAAHATLVGFISLEPRTADSGHGEEFETALTFLIPAIPERRLPPTSGRTPERGQRPPSGPAAVPAGAAPDEVTEPVTPPLARIDWAAEAQKEAADASRRNVKSQDDASRRADALASRARSSPHWQAHVPQESWRGWSEQAHGLQISPGALLYHVNEHCVVGIFIILPGFGCRIGKIEHRADLFLRMHPPVQFGDWKDR